MDDYPLSVKTRGGSDMKKLWIGLVLLSLIFVLLPTSTKAKTEGKFEYSVENGEATITKYYGTDAAVEIPSELGG